MLIVPGAAVLTALVPLIRALRVAQAEVLRYVWQSGANKQLTQPKP